MKQINKNTLKYNIVCLLLCLFPAYVFAQDIVTDINFGYLAVEGYEASPYTMPVKPSRNVAYAHFSLPENAKVRIASYPESGFSGVIKIYEHDGAKREIFVEPGKGSYLEGTTCLMAGTYDVHILCTYTGSRADVYRFLLMIWTYELNPGEYPYEPIEGEDTEKEPSYGSFPDSGITTSRSYLREKTMLSGDGLNSMEKISYFDGLGRHVQTVFRDFTPSHSDFADFTDYNARGLTWRQWLPAPVHNTEGAFINVLPYLTESAMNDKAPYLRTVYERSSLNRPVYTCGAGVDFADKRASVDYLYNRTDSLTCMKYGVYNDKLAQYGYYPQGTLEVKRHTDEDGNVKYVFTDRMGRVVLERLMDGDTPYDTYYVYTPGGDLRYVLPPMMDGNLSDYYADRYAYQYRYDGLHRLTEKKLPGCEPIRYVYDNTDRIALRQDGNLRKQEKWIFTLTDSFGREVVSGLCNFSGFPTNMTAKAVYDATGGVAESGYTFTDVSTPSLLFIKYYDSYDYLQLPSVKIYADSLSYTPVEGYGKRYETTPAPLSTNGKLTGTRVFSPETGEEIITAYYYDDKGNVVQQLSTNHLGGYDRDFFAYTFTGKILRKLHCHSIEGGFAISESYDYTYDHAERILSVTHRVGDNPAVVLSSNEYDPLCRLQSSTFHNGLMKLDYTYNTRGWRTGTNSDKFSQSVHYTDGEGIPRYNGNISSMELKTASDSLLRGYCFDYDEVNRLTAAVYGEGDSLGINIGHFNEEVTSYDKHGNILGLRRSGQISETDYGVIDHLNLSYDGNLLQSVSDSAADSVYGNGFEFKDSANSEIEYFYDANGNLTKDLNKNISDIQYNCLNLPSRIEFEDGNSISYVYDANGTKLRTIHLLNGVTATTDYCGNVIYENGVARLLLTECGYITLSDTVYHYFLQDHQGNNRVVVDEDGDVEEVNHYYPFGGVFAQKGNVQPYKYNGKEFDSKQGLDWYDYGARRYDAAIGRFIRPDRFSEKYVSLSPYQYAANNPVNIVDINGDSLLLNKTSAAEAMLAIYNGLENGTNINMKFNNGMLDPTSIEAQAKTTSDFFLQDLYEIATNEKIVELSLSDDNTYIMNGHIINESFIAPEEYDTSQYGAAFESMLVASGQLTGKVIEGNLGQTLVPGNKAASGKRSTNNNIQIIINKKGELNHRTVGIAHEFGHVLLYLRGLPFSHSQRGVDSFVYKKNDDMMKRLGYGK